MICAVLCRIDRQMLLELGRLKMVGGEEHMIVDVVLDIVPRREDAP
jgi:hypothetical protein